VVSWLGSQQYRCDGRRMHRSFLACPRRTMGGGMSVIDGISLEHEGKYPNCRQIKRLSCSSISLRRQIQATDTSVHSLSRHYERCHVRRACAYYLSIHVDRDDLPTWVHIFARNWVGSRGDPVWTVLFVCSRPRIEVMRSPTGDSCHVEPWRYLYAGDTLVHCFPLYVQVLSMFVHISHMRSLTLGFAESPGTERYQTINHGYAL